MATSLETDQAGYDMAKTGPKVRNLHVGTVQWRYALKHGGVLVAQTTESAGIAFRAALRNFDVCTHVHECFRLAEAIFVDGFVDCRGAVRLGQGDANRGLPVRHETGVNRSGKIDGMKFAVLTPEVNSRR